MTIPVSATTYDQVRYPTFSFPQTHPDSLATMAILHGMQPAPVTHCRVLELGCGTGWNLIPVAYQLPESTFIGIDLSESAIAYGQQQVEQLGLKNIELRYQNIMDVAASDGQFDYIIAHGVYSWVPPFVREKILAIFKENLAPDGVAYVSYNCYPGSHLRNIARDLMLFHVSGVSDPVERVQQSRAVMKFLVDANVEYETYRRVLKDQFERVMKMSDEVLFHDDLEEGSTPFYFHEVAGEAKKRGLQYLSETDYAHADLREWPQSVADTLKNIPDTEVVAREQYLDFVRCRTFRQTLLCHEHIKLERNFEPQTLEQFYLATPAVPVTGQIDPTTREVVEFKREKKTSMSTDHPLIKAAIIYLREKWPQDISFNTLLDESLAQLGKESYLAQESYADAAKRLSGVLFQAYAAGFLDMRLSPTQCTGDITVRPVASAIVRQQIQNGPMVTNLRHSTVKIEDQVTRRFLPLLDGTRDHDQLFVALNELIKTINAGTSATTEVSREVMEENLQHLVGLALFIDKRDLQ